ncbi:MAG: class I SAM-dependent methyltransferase [Acholeplasmataceae bacterium]|jgi:hypothetical protein
MRKSKIVQLSHEILSSLVNENDIIIDATLGNGFDSLFLSPLVSQIFSFDIQEMALNKSLETLKDVSNVNCLLDSHLNYKKYLINYDGVVFNLGFLPNGDKRITTTSITTINTLKLMVNDNLARFILIVVYPKHPEGSIESKDLLAYIKNISNYNVTLINYDENIVSDYIILLEKRA